jgi:hypothetical protein
MRNAIDGAGFGLRFIPGRESEVGRHESTVKNKLLDNEI